MKSTVIFKGSNEELYLYDTINKYLLNCHPIIEQISNIKSDEYETIKNIIFDANPEIIGSESEFEFYYKKYLFLKNNGFFSIINPKDLLSGAVTYEVVEHTLSDLGNVVFQVTNDCNMRCKYCCFGEFYNGVQEEINNMDFDTVKHLFDYLVPLWNSRSNSSYKNIVNIGFYGGEPLLNFKLISQIILYCENLKLDNNTYFTYSITTNATLLPRYIDYLIKYDFNILVSLDGDKNSDSYRVDCNNNQTFDRIFNNLKFIQKTHKEYFEKKVNFNSVLTDRSTVEGIHEFIYNSFAKIPLIDPISTSNLKESGINSFFILNQEYIEDMNLSKKRGIFSSKGKELSRFFYYNLNNSYRHYADLMTENDTTLFKRVPTGTCLPFANKIFITSSGNIMACERIPMKHILGYIDKDGVSININNIITTYNKYFDILREFCKECYHSNTCSICIFQTKFINELPQCPHIFSEKDFQLYLGRIVSVIEENPNLFFEFNKTVFV